MTTEKHNLEKELETILDSRNLNVKIPIKYQRILSDAVGKDNIIVNEKSGYIKVKHFGESPNSIIGKLSDTGSYLSETPFIKELNKHRKKNAIKQKNLFKKNEMEGGGNETLESLLKQAQNQKMDDRLYLKCPGDNFSL